MVTCPNETKQCPECEIKFRFEGQFYIFNEKSDKVTEIKKNRLFYDRKGELLCHNIQIITGLGETKKCP